MIVEVSEGPSIEMEMLGCHNTQRGYPWYRGNEGYGDTSRGTTIWPGVGVTSRSGLQTGLGGRDGV